MNINSVSQGNLQIILATIEEEGETQESTNNLTSTTLGDGKRGEENGLLVLIMG